MELKQIRKLALAAGWREEPTTGKHVRYLAPDGVGMVLAPSSPSDWRALRNLESEFKRQGLDLQAFKRQQEEAKRNRPKQALPEFPAELAEALYEETRQETITIELQPATVPTSTVVEDQGVGTVAKDKTIAEQMAELQAQMEMLQQLAEKEGAQEAAKEYATWLGKAGAPLSVDTLTSMLSPVPQDVLRQATALLLSGGSSKAAKASGTRAPRLSEAEQIAGLPKGTFTVADYAKAIDRNTATAANYIKALVASGAVKDKGTDPKSKSPRPAKLYEKA